MPKKSPEQEAFENQKDSRQPPRQEERGPEPPPGMGSKEAEKGKGTGPAPLPRDQVGGRG